LKIDTNAQRRVTAETDIQFSVFQVKAMLGAFPFRTFFGIETRKGARKTAFRETAIQGSAGIRGRIPGKKGRPQDKPRGWFF
jgi:hypothetical protein